MRIHRTRPGRWSPSKISPAGIRSHAQNKTPRLPGRKRLPEEENASQEERTAVLAYRNERSNMEILMKRRHLVSTALALAAMATPARADLVVAGDSVFATANSEATVDFHVGTNAGDMVSAFGLQLQITTTSGSALLQFTSSQTDPY